MISFTYVLCLIFILCVCLCMYVCVCVCERERERERELWCVGHSQREKQKSSARKVTKIETPTAVRTITRSRAGHYQCYFHAHVQGSIVWYTYLSISALTVDAWLPFKTTCSAINIVGAFSTSRCT